VIIAMDCRKFHKSLEDYLQGGLDFSGRFGMERHAQQCISCGEDLANAQQLSQMTSDLERVKAPLNFEAKLLQEIGKRKSHGRFSYFHRTWMYGFDSFSWRKVALAGCGCAALALGIAYWPRHSAGIANTSPAPSYVAAEPSNKVVEQPKAADNKKFGAAFHEPVVPEARAVMASSKASPEIQPLRPADEELFTEPEVADTEFTEYVMEGPDNRPVTVRLPKRIRMQYSPASEEYFIRNVSH
jgi:hypothetical protein